VEKVKQITSAAIKQEKEIIDAETIKKTTVVKAEKEIIEAETTKKITILKAEQDKETLKIDAEAVKYKTETIAEGDKNAKEREAAAIVMIKEAEANGVKAVGLANAEAEKQMQLARVTAEITLSEKIGNNEGYQEYIVRLESVKQQAAVAIEQAKYGAEVGKAQAANLSRANIKIIANTSDGNVGGGVSKIMDLFSPKGGTAVGGMLEAVSQTDNGKALLARLGIENTEKEN
jgi:flotillin